MNRFMNETEYRIPFSRAEFIQTLADSHFYNEDCLECLKIQEKLDLSDIKAKVWYRLEKENTILAVMTLGKEFDDLTDKYEKDGELLLAYALECLGMRILKIAYDMFREKFYEKEGKYLGVYHFLEEKEMEDMPKVLKQMEIREVRCNQALALIPQKTVVFLTEMSDERKAGCMAICENCSQRNCPNTEAIKGEPGAALHYGYQRILGNGGGGLWKKD